MSDVAIQYTAHRHTYSMKMMDARCYVQRTLRKKRKQEKEENIQRRGECTCSLFVVKLKLRHIRFNRSGV